MKFKNNLVAGKLIKRYKRFLVDVELDDESIITAHCNNSGSMKTCIEEGARVYLSESDNPKRKTKFSWEMIFINNGWIGVNTIIPNKLVYDAIINGGINKLKGYKIVKREVTYSDSRFDIYAENANEKCFIEVKNVSMKVNNYARFPDAVTVRGKKHLETLIKVKQAGYRAVMVYVIQRMDINMFGTDKNIDPNYAETLLKAVAEGVEIIPLQAKVTPTGIKIIRELEADLLS